MDIVAMVFSHYPSFYNSLWTCMEPITGAEQFRNACFELRATAENSAINLGHQNLTQNLIETGYSKSEIEDITPTFQARPVVIEYHHADKELNKVYDDIKTVLGLSFLNTDYRAFARWPTYVETSW